MTEPTRTGHEGKNVPGWMLEGVAELSKSARTLYTLYAGFLIYCALTLFSTSDRRIILDEQAHLPIVNLDVPFSAFVPIASFIAIFFFIYFQVHLHALTEQIAAVRGEDEQFPLRRLRHWTINFSLEAGRGPLGHLQMLITKLSLWWLLPSVLVMFTFWTFKKHSWLLSGFEWLISAGSACLVGWLRYRLERMKLALEEPAPEAAVSTWQNMFRRRYKGLVVYACIAIAVHSFLIYGMLVVQDAGPARSFLYTRLFTVDLSGQTLVSEKGVEGAPWVDLHGARLEGAYLTSTTLRHANLKEARLRWARFDLADLADADFTEADLTEASLRSAKLSGAILYSANLTEAQIYRADLSGATLIFAKLEKADLSEANLHGASLRGANLTGAELRKADMSGVDLRGAGVKAEQFAAALTLYQAQLDPGLLSEVTRRYPSLLSEAAK